MGSMIETNDTLQLTLEQGFPSELDYAKHKNKPFMASDFNDKIFAFKNKDNIRIYHMLPVRNFLVQNIGGQWLYWGLVHILDVSHDYQKKTTSGTFKIIYIYTPEEMKQAHKLIDRRLDTDYFGVMK